MRLGIALVLAIAGVLLVPEAVSAEDGAARQSVRLKTGRTWRGRIGDVVTVEWRRGPRKVELTGTVTLISKAMLKVQPEGKASSDTVLVNAITSIRTVDASAIGDATPAPADAPSTPEEGDQDAPTETQQIDRSDATASASNVNEKGEVIRGGTGDKGIFILPMSGSVGKEFRPEEIIEIARQADERAERDGMGQVIVLDINSGGGLVAECRIIMDEVEKACERHTVVGWVDHAISAASMTTLMCDVVVFRQHGHTGGITMIRGNTSVSEGELEAWIRDLEKILAKKNRSKYWARPLVVSESLLSATKDPITGEVEWFPDLTGERIFSSPGQNLMFNADEAVEYGFAAGIANNPEELAKVLGLKNWELDGTGQELHDERYELRDKFLAAVRKDQYRLGLLGNSRGDIQKRIRIFQSWMTWWRKVPNQCRMNGLPPVAQIKEMIAEQRDALRRMSGG